MNEHQILSRLREGSRQDRLHACYDVMRLDDCEDTLTSELMKLAYSTVADLNDGLQVSELALMCLGHVIAISRSRSEKSSSVVLDALQLLESTIRDGSIRRKHIAMRAVGHLSGPLAEGFLPAIRQVAETAEPCSLLGLRAYQTVARINVQLTEDEFWEQVLRQHPNADVDNWLREV